MGDTVVSRRHVSVRDDLSLWADSDTSPSKMVWLHGRAVLSPQKVSRSAAAIGIRARWVEGYK